MRTLSPSVSAAPATSAGSVPAGTVASQVSVIVPAVGPSRASAFDSEITARGVLPKAAPDGAGAMPTTVKLCSWPVAVLSFGNVTVSPRETSRVEAAFSSSTISVSSAAGTPSSRCSAVSWPGGAIVACRKELVPSPSRGR